MREIVIILGKELSDDGVMSEELKTRCACGKRIAEERGCGIIVTGGKRRPCIPFTEADAMKEYLLSLGFGGEIVTEGNSRITKQNAQFCAPLVENFDKIYLCSSKSHLRRLYMRPVSYFKRYTKKIIVPCPADT